MHLLLCHKMLQREQGMHTEQGNSLLTIGRVAIARALNQPCQLNIDETVPWLQEMGACFVTLMQNNKLRGCVGSLQAHRSLLADVQNNAISAALHDSRFSPLESNELDYTEIEISLVYPSQKMVAQDEADVLAQLRPGVDGIVFEYGYHRSTFLPQVWEMFPQPQQFLAKLKQKAGLPVDFWSEAITLSRYTVTKWRESDMRWEENSNG